MHEYLTLAGGGMQSMSAFLLKNAFIAFTIIGKTVGSHFNKIKRGFYLSLFLPAWTTILLHFSIYKRHIHTYILFNKRNVMRRQ